MRMQLFKNTSNASTFTLTAFSELTNTVNSSGYGGAKNLTVVIKAHSTSSAKMSINAVVWTATNGAITSIQYAVIYESGGGVLCFVRLSTAAFDIAASNSLTINNPTNGVFVLSGGTTE